jgi:pimeloyl-ACP methyl ester carboxylesterase
VVIINMGRRSIFAAGLLAAAATASPFPRLDTSKRQEDKSAPTFSHIEPSAELKWVDCFKEKWRCAYLTVPLDYANTSAGTIDVAFVKYLYSEDAEDVIFNPGKLRHLPIAGFEPGVLTLAGGPSEPGVNSLTSETNGASYGQEWSEKWGVNMVSFDPRGVGWTGPDVSCTPANGTKLERRDELQTAMEKAYGEMLKTNRACSEANKDTDAKYIGTSAVVQDLMHFTELSAALKGKDPKTAGINYFGVSYGTVIGQTLAQMYPDRIRRVLLDANVNSVTYYQGWNPDCLDDLAHAFWMFSHICHKAGSEWCALTEGKRSTEEVLDRIEDAMAALDKEPIAITFKGQELPISKTYFVQALRQFLYYPRAHFNDIANITLAAETRNVPVFEDLLAKGIPALAKGGNVKRETPNPSGDEQRIINAVDIAGRYPWKNFEDYYAAVKRIKAPYASESFATGNG